MADSMREGDIAAIVRIESACHPDPWPEAALRDELQTPVSTQTVLRDGPDVVAYLVTWLVADEVTILNVTVAPSHQRRGLARRLLTDALAAAHAAGARLALLEVRASNAAARALYASLGFHEAGVRRGYYEQSGEDAILMERDLSLSPA